MDHDDQHAADQHAGQGCHRAKRADAGEFARQDHNRRHRRVEDRRHRSAKEVNGVYSLGGGASRVVGALRERIPGASVNHSQGVSVEVGEKQAAVDIDIVADYGVSITDLANGLRRNVIAAIERMTGLEVTEVNVTVHDVHLEDDDDGSEEAAPARVQ